MRLIKSIKRLIKSIRLYFVTARFARSCAELMSLISDVQESNEGGEA